MTTTIPPTTSKIAKRQTIRRMEEAAPVTIQMVADAMKKHKGNKSKVAQELNVPIEVIRRKVKFTPELQRIAFNLREERLDKAEEKLDEQVENGNITAITYTLNNLGKERGYGKGEDHEVNVNVHHSAGLIKRLRENINIDSFEEDDIVELEETEWEQDNEDED